MMGIEDFWPRLVTAARWFRASSTSGGYEDIDPDSLTRTPDGTPLWLTPDAVQWFDVRDFEVLDPESRERLRQAVERFRSVASEVRPKRPATADQIREAATAFLEILKILRPDQFHDADSFLIQTFLERELRGKLPRWITGISCNTGTDVGGDPAVFISINVTDAAVDRKWFGRKSLEIREQVRATFRRMGNRRWPYIGFQNPSELTDAEGKR